MDLKWVINGYDRLWIATSHEKKTFQVALLDYPNNRRIYWSLAPVWSWTPCAYTYEAGII
jgi:hypothetical protein